MNNVQVAAKNCEVCRVKQHRAGTQAARNCAAELKRREIEARETWAVGLEPIVAYHPIDLVLMACKVF
jgi:hypothetical protein